jgi:hypothetical protein
MTPNSEIHISFHDTLVGNKDNLIQKIMHKFPRVISVDIDKEPYEQGQKHLKIHVDNIDGQEILDYILGGDNRVSVSCVQDSPPCLPSLQERKPEQERRKPVAEVDKIEELKKIVKALQGTLSIFVQGNDDLQKQIDALQKQVVSMPQNMNQQLKPIQDQIANIKKDIEGTPPAAGAKNQGIMAKIDRIETHLAQLTIPKYSK